MPRRLPLIAAFVLAVVLAVVLIASGNPLGWALLVIDLALLAWNIRLDRREARLRRERERQLANVVDDMRAKGL